MRIRDDQGWHGDMSDTWRGEDELVKAIRAGLKKISPDCKWSVTRRKTTLTPIITVALMEAPEYPVSTWTNGGIIAMSTDLQRISPTGSAMFLSMSIISLTR